MMEKSPRKPKPLKWKMIDRRDVVNPLDEAIEKLDNWIEIKDYTGKHFPGDIVYMKDVLELMKKARESLLNESE